MPFKIEIKEEAKADISDAMKWYATKAENLDIRFVAAVEAAFLKIQRNPFAFKKCIKSSGKPPLNPSRILFFTSRNKVIL